MTKPGLDISTLVAAPPGIVLKAFFDAEALHAWWRVAHSVTTPRTLGPYTLEWPPTDFHDDILGRLGGVLRGTVMEFHAGQGFLVADLFWLPPDGDPIGPMALEVSVQAEGNGTRVRIVQNGYEEGPRWQRYYEVIAHGWERALAGMKNLLEK